MTIEIAAETSDAAVEEALLLADLIFEEGRSIQPLELCNYIDKMIAYDDDIRTVTLKSLEVANINPTITGPQSA